MVAPCQEWRRPAVGAIPTGEKAATNPHLADPVQLDGRADGHPPIHLVLWHCSRKGCVPIGVGAR